MHFDSGCLPNDEYFDVTENENMGLAAKGSSPSQRVQALIFIFSSESESLSRLLDIVILSGKRIRQ